MKLGVFAVLLGQKNLKEALGYLSDLGVQAVEIGTGGYPGNAHANAAELIANPEQLGIFRQTIADSGLTLSGLSCHGNPIHPQAHIAEAFHRDIENTILLAEALGLDRIIAFSGCPGDSPSSQWPNWVTCPWPNDYLKVLDYQWHEVLIPYWRRMAAFAREHGVRRIALEMHPGFCVYNPETLLRLRDAVGDVIGANFDPSHLFWQGIDPVAAIRKLGSAIYFFHAKDCSLDPLNIGVNGVLDTKPYHDAINRSWIFRTVGYGHGGDVWRDIISALRLVGYDDVISIEHEDSLISPGEGLTKAIEFLRQCLFFSERGDIWWA